ncbi:MAG: hypothetical protein K6G74_04985 [Bacilli bacterium]|nr:hypothetical protein [Bacilli bacterium]
MNKLMTFINKHPIISSSIVVGTLAIIISGTSFIVTGAQYAAYADSYDKAKEELNAVLPQLPEETFKDNNFVTYDDAAKTVTETKSTYKGSYVYDIHDAEVKLESGEPVYETVEGTSWEVASGFKKGGSITYTIETSKYGKADIDIVLAVGEVKTQQFKKDNKTTTEPMNITNVTDYIMLTINDLQIKTVNFDIPADDSYHHLVLKNAHLITGVNTLKFETWITVNDNFIMPAVRTVSFLTDAAIV